MDVLQNTYFKKLLDANIDHVNDDIKLALLDSNHTQDKDTHEFFDDVNANEVSGTGYTAGGQSIANTSTAVDDTADDGTFDGDDVVWSNASITARYGVVYKDTGDNSTSPIIGIFDFGQDFTAAAGDFTVSFNSDGIVVIS